MSEFVEVKTQSLEFGALDWCIAQIEKLNVELTPPNYGNGTALVFIAGTEPLYRPSTDWNHIGPLIDKFRVSIIYSDEVCDPCAWTDSSAAWHASTPLIAACRAIVASVLGETVSVPKELLS